MMGTFSFQSKLSQLFEGDRKLTVVKENHLSEANFVFPHLIGHVLSRGDAGILLVCLNKPFEHYRMTTTKLCVDIDYDRLKTVEDFHEIIFESHRTDSISEFIARNLLDKIVSALKEFTSTKYLIIDDVSHLLDLGVDVKDVINLINVLINLEVSCVIGTHVTEGDDKILSNNLCYIADLLLEVLPLRTGRSVEVTGILKVKRKGSPDADYQFQALDKRIRLFKPGESIAYFNC